MVSFPEINHEKKGAGKRELQIWWYIAYAVRIIDNSNLLRNSETHINRIYISANIYQTLLVKIAFCRWNKAVNTFFTLLLSKTNFILKRKRLLFTFCHCVFILYDPGSFFSCKENNVFSVTFHRATLCENKFIVM